MPEHDRRASDRPPPAAADFDALYDARYGDVVAMVYALAGDLAEAQDLAQEAFCRAWQRWGDVSRTTTRSPGSAGSRPTSPRPGGGAAGSPARISAGSARPTSPR
ncbi:sigma factor [Dactylosporangium sp. NPDC050588]|uniref:sigma factor n=1 Tax=Dactylosporangium sp. NPDC050588 TaxID=3157211 RepID=UPI00340B1F9C